MATSRTDLVTMDLGKYLRISDLGSNLHEFFFGLYDILNAAKTSSHDSSDSTTSILGGRVTYIGEICTIQ